MISLPSFRAAAAFGWLSAASLGECCPAKNARNIKPDRNFFILPPAIVVDERPEGSTGVAAMSNFESPRGAIIGETIDADPLTVAAADKPSIRKNAEEQMAAELSILDEALPGPGIQTPAGQKLLEQRQGDGGGAIAGGRADERVQGRCRADGETFEKINNPRRDEKRVDVIPVKVLRLDGERRQPRFHKIGFAEREPA